MTPICPRALNTSFLICAIYAASCSICLQDLLHFRTLRQTCLWTATSTFSASVFRIWHIMGLFPIKIVPSPTCSTSKKFWRQSLGQGWVLDAHEAVWLWWKFKTGTHHNVVRAFSSSLSRHRHHRYPQEVKAVLRWMLVIRWSRWWGRRSLNGGGAWLVRQIWWPGNQWIVHGYVLVFNLRLFLSIYLSQSVMMFESSK